MNALVPKGFGLDSHHFHPGHYQLVFRRKSERLEFNRWGPADVLLKQGGLLEWYDERSRGNRHTVTSSLKADEYNGKPALTGKVEDPSSFIRRLWSQIVGRHSYNWIRIWHLRERNQILGVEASDSRKLPSVSQNDGRR